MGSYLHIFHVIFEQTINKSIKIWYRIHYFSVHYFSIDYFSIDYFIEIL